MKRGRPTTVHQSVHGIYMCVGCDFVYWVCVCVCVCVHCGGDVLSLTAQTCFATNSPHATIHTLNNSDFFIIYPPSRRHACTHTRLTCACPSISSHILSIITTPLYQARHSSFPRLLVTQCPSHKIVALQLHFARDGVGEGVLGERLRRRLISVWRA